MSNTIDTTAVTVPRQFRDGLLIGANSAPVAAKVEVCRSFAYKLNLQNHGGNPYESADFFASRKMECAVEAAEWVSEQIYEECVAEVRATVAAFIDEMRRKKQIAAERRTA